jgi:glycerate kinase
MPLRVLIVPDKFKGTLTAHDAAHAIADGWRQARPGDHLDILPMTDGGDGFGSVLGELLQARPRRAKTVDAAHRPLRGPWWFGKSKKIAIIDSAAIIGLAMLPRGKFHPFQLDTFGLGHVIQTAVKSGVREIIVGVGGSATNDAGFGLARALGWKFFNRNGDELTEWWRLHELAEIDRPGKKPSCIMTGAVDVTNPLLGPSGCTRTYGPQKGLRSEDFPLAEKCLTRLATVLRSQHGIVCSNIPGAGAAGGLGFGLMAFAGAKLQPGFEIFAARAKLRHHIKRADLVITGEGQIDRQTAMGKGTGQIAQLCRQLKIPCLALAGTIASPVRNFTHARALTEITSRDGAQAKASLYLQGLTRQMAESFEGKQGVRVALPT